MIYLIEEKIAFAKIQTRYNAALEELHSQMAQVYQERGDRMDIESPIHHRLSPDGMLHEVKKKAGRIESTMGHQDWERNPKLLGKIVEECIDMANYACFLGALAVLLFDEEARDSTCATRQRNEKGWPGPLKEARDEASTD